jgi:ribosomal protein S18 acetylase RimI-like enzyme
VPATTTASARLEARISTDLHGLLKRAAELRVRTMTDFVVAAAQDAAGHLAGDYTLAAARVPLTDLPAALAKNLPRYRAVPTVRMGCLAVNPRFKGQGLVVALLADALARCIRSEITAYALVVAAKDEQASAFY